MLRHLIHGGCTLIAASALLAPRRPVPRPGRDVPYRGIGVTIYGIASAVQVMLERILIADGAQYADL